MTKELSPVELAEVQRFGLDKPPLDDASAEARAAFPFPGFNNQSLEDVRRLRADFDRRRTLGGN